MHEEGFKKALTNVVNRYARSKGHLKEKDDNLQGEDIREGLTAIISVLAQGPAVRGPDQGEARERVDAFARRARHQREAGGVAGGEPTRGEPDRPEGLACGSGASSGPSGARPHKAQVGSGRRRPSRKARRLPFARTRERASCSSSRETRRAARPSRPATLRPRRSCRSEGRS